MSDNLYKRGDIWWGRIQVSGHDLRRSLRTSNRAEAKKRLEKWIAEVSHTAFYGDARATYKDAVTRWAGEYLPGAVKPATAQRYLVSARQLDPFFADLYVDEITRRKVSDYISARRKAGATNATIRRDLTALSRILACCVAWGWRDDNPAREFDRSIIRERRDPIKPPTDEQIAAVVAKCQPMVAALVLFLAQTGMRQEEAVGLEWPQVDLVRREVTLLKTKTSRPRVVTLSPEAVGTIVGTPRHITSPYVFWHGDGQRYVEFSSRFHAICKAAGQHFRCHDLRHRFAIEWLKAGGDIYKLSRHLGHSSVKTTEIYLGHVGESRHETRHSNNGSAEVVGGEKGH